MLHCYNSPIGNSLVLYAVTIQPKGKKKTIKNISSECGGRWLIILSHNLKVVVSGGVSLNVEEYLSIYLQTLTPPWPPWPPWPPRPRMSALIKYGKAQTGRAHVKSVFLQRIAPDSIRIIVQYCILSVNFVTTNKMATHPDEVEAY